MYSLVLVLHSWLRWIALVAGVGATFAALTDRGGPARADLWGLVLMMMLGVQLLLGLLVYLVLSPFTQEAMRQLGAAMQNPALRFYAVEHASMMLTAVVLVHVGRVLARKAATPDAKRMRLIMSFGGATLLMLLAMPWPGMVSGRPLFRV